MFAVIIAVRGKVPSSFEPSAPGVEENERAMMYIEPFLNATFRLAALPHILGVVDSDRLCMYNGGRL